MTISTTTKPVIKLRFRLYFWLMNICLVCAALGLADFLRTELFAWHPWEDDNPVYDILGWVILFFSFPIAMLLVLARFMRDEYAEILWQRTAVVMAYAIAVSPIVLFVLAWASFWLIEQRSPPPLFGWLYGDNSGFDALTKVWQSFLLLFVGIFQFLHWRSSR